MKQEEENEDKGGRVGNRGMQEDKVEKMNAEKATLKLGNVLDNPSKLSPGGVRRVVFQFYGESVNPGTI